MAEFTFHIFCLALKSIKGEDNTADKHVGVHQRAVDLGEEHLELRKAHCLTKDKQTLLNNLNNKHFVIPCTFSSVLTYLLNLLKASMLNFISSPSRSK